MQNSWAIIQVNSLGNTADRGFQTPCGWRRVNWRKQERHSKGYPGFGQIWFHSGSLGKPVVGSLLSSGVVWSDSALIKSNQSKTKEKCWCWQKRRWCFGPWEKSWDGEIWSYSQRILKAGPSGLGALREVREEGRRDGRGHAKAEIVRKLQIRSWYPQSPLATHFQHVFLRQYHCRLGNSKNWQTFQPRSIRRLCLEYISTEVTCLLGPINRVISEAKEGSADGSR